jgi:hypothetical protein
VRSVGSCAELSERRAACGVERASAEFHAGHGDAACGNSDSSGQHGHATGQHRYAAGGDGNTCAAESKRAGSCARLESAEQHESGKYAAV